MNKLVFRYVFLLVLLSAYLRLSLSLSCARFLSVLNALLSLPIASVHFQLCRLAYCISIGLRFIPFVVMHPINRLTDFGLHTTIYTANCHYKLTHTNTFQRFAIFSVLCLARLDGIRRNLRCIVF